MSSLDAGTASAGNVGPADERPLTQQEYQLLQRLLSDPFSLPIQFKTWLISFLETSDMNLPLSAVAGLTAMLGISGLGSGSLGILPAGIILPYGADTAPTGALMCDGAAYSRATQQRLWNAIGSRYGTPDASTFNVPDLQERIPVGRGVLADVDTLGKNEGRSLGLRGPRHWHTGATSSHTHPLGREAVSLTPGGTAYSILGNQSIHDAATDAASPAVNVGTPTNRPQDGPAFLTINFIIVA